MDEQTVADILATHADRLNLGEREAAGLPGLSAEQLSALDPLMRVAERIQGVLAPVQPSPTFVRQLGQQLIATTSRGRKAMTQRTRRAILIVAAALGSAVSVASAVGIIIYLIRHRARVQPKQAVSVR
jgi:hypothetical protein